MIIGVVAAAAKPPPRNVTGSDTVRTVALATPTGLVVVTTDTSQRQSVVDSGTLLDER